MKIDTERLIFEVHFRPLLWDKQNKLYRNRDARDAAWLEICKEQFPDFDDLTRDEQKEIDKKIQQRWRTARDMYKKEKMGENQPSCSGAKKKRKYAYFEILTFLDRVIDGAADKSLPEGNNVIALSPSATTVTSPPTSAPVSPLPSTQYLKSSQLELESDDLAFFQSLQPILKKFTIYQKMMFRTKVMQTIMEIDNSLLENSFVETPLGTRSPPTRIKNERTFSSSS